MIFCFSATGNSLQAAETVAGITGDRILNIAREIEGNCSYTVAEGESVGIVCPVHFYGLPMIVEDFIRKMSFDGDPDFYVVLTYGTFPGNAVKDACSLLSKNGHRAIASMSVKMPENYLLLFNPPDERTARRILSDAKSQIKEFAGMLAEGTAELSTDSNIWHNIFGKIARPFYTYGRGTGRFHTNTNCMKCGRCVDMCPSKAIQMVDRIPTWISGKCLRCCACINRCPYQAIEFGLMTKKRRRYVNPETSDRIDRK